MNGEQLVPKVRQLVLQTATELGFVAQQPAETTLDGCFRPGCRFDLPGLIAIWAADEARLEFYNAMGERLRVVALPAESLAVRTAA